MLHTGRTENEKGRRRLTAWRNKWMIYFNIAQCDVLERSTTLRGTDLGPREWPRQRALAIFKVFLTKPEKVFDSRDEGKRLAPKQVVKHGLSRPITTSTWEYSHRYRGCPRAGVAVVVRSISATKRARLYRSFQRGYW
jgi:hypothetical protein